MSLCIDDVVKSLHESHRVEGSEEPIALELLSAALTELRRHYPAQWRPRLPITINNFVLSDGICEFDLPASIKFTNCWFGGSKETRFVSLRCHDLQFEGCVFFLPIVFESPDVSGTFSVKDVSARGILFHDIAVQGDVKFLGLNNHPLHDRLQRPSHLRFERGSIGRSFVFQSSVVSSADFMDVVVGGSLSVTKCEYFERNENHSDGKSGAESGGAPRDESDNTRDDTIFVYGCRIADRCVISDVGRVYSITLENTVIGRDLEICGANADLVQIKDLRVMASAEIGDVTTTIGTLDLGAVDVRHDLVIDLKSQGWLNRLKVDRSNVAGNFVFSNCLIRPRAGRNSEEAIDIANTSIDGSLHADRIRVSGDVSLRGIWIGRDLRFDEAGIVTASQPIDLSGLWVGGRVSFARTTLDGGVTMEEARVGGLSLNEGVSIVNPRSERALINLRNMSCGSSLEFPGTTLRGRIDLSGAELKGDLRLRGAKVLVSDLSKEEGAKPVARHVAIDLRDAKVGRLEMPDEARSIEGFVDLRGCTAATLVDKYSSWAKSNEPSWAPLLSGFVYSRLEDPKGCRKGTFGAVHPRVGWLELAHEEGGREPLRQLARTLRTQGDPDGAEKVVIEYRRSRRRGKHGLEWLLDLMLDVCSRYGYEPRRAVYCSIAVLITFGLFWSLVAHLGCSENGCHDQSLFVRTLPGDFAVDDEEDKEDKLRSVYPAFNGFAYSVDLFFPFVDFGMDSRWMPNVSVCSDAVQKSGSCLSDRRVLMGWLLYLLVWIEIVAGSLLTALTVISFTGVLRPENSDG